MKKQVNQHHQDKLQKVQFTEEEELAFDDFSVHAMSSKFQNSK